MHSLPKPSTAPSKGLAAIIGAAAAAVLMAIVPTFEGTKYTTYKDPIGVLTYCTGATDGAIWGKTYTPAECSAQLDKDMAFHAAGVMACIKVPLSVGQKIAFVDVAYNIGVSAFCNSSMAKFTNAGDAVKGCEALTLWNKAGGKVWPGLVRRREVERQYCRGILKP